MTGEWELLTPTRIAAALDQFIIGQSEAKKAVAVALRTVSEKRKLRGGWQSWFPLRF